jgi:hypothetical protein
MIAEELHDHLAEFNIVVDQEDRWLFAIAIHESAPHCTVNASSQGADATAALPELCRGNGAPTVKVCKH